MTKHVLYIQANLKQSASVDYGYVTWEIDPGGEFKAFGVAPKYILTDAPVRPCGAKILLDSKIIDRVMQLCGDSGQAQWRIDGDSLVFEMGWKGSEDTKCT